MNKTERLMIALGSIALGTIAFPGSAQAQERADLCEWLSNRSVDELQQFVRDNPNDSCAEVAALMLVERTQPAADGQPAVGSRFIGSRY
jgi:uncharacterized protein YcfJ